MKSLRPKPINFLDEIWLPPEGHSFATLFATTFTLEENVLGELALHFLPSNSRRTVSPNEADPGALKALLLTRLRQNFRVVYDRSALVKNGKLGRSRYGIFAPYLKEMVPKKSQGAHTHFHPKVFWVLYADEATSKITRAKIVISSQNLTTSSDCLEAGLVLNFELSPKGYNRKSQPVVQAALSELARIITPWAGKALTDQLLKQTRRFKCTNLPASFESLRIFNPQGTKRPIETLFRRSGGAKWALFVSPFVRKNQLADVQRLAVEQNAKIGIVTRQDTLNALIPVEGLKVDPYDRLRFGTTKALDAGADRRLHAKLCIIRGDTSTKLTVGSSNLTHGGWSRNVEVNAEFETKVSQGEFNRVWATLLPLSAPELCTAPGAIDEELDSVERSICLWISEWTVEWQKRLPNQTAYNELPLSIVTTPCPKELWDQVKNWRATIRTGTIATLPQRLMRETGVISVPTTKPFALDELNPLVEIQVGEVRHWIIPNYESFPAKGVFETVHIQDLIDALALLLRPSSATKWTSQQSKRRPDQRPSVTPEAGVNLEKVLLSFLKEALPEGIDRETRLKRASEIREWVTRASKSAKEPSHQALIEGLSAIADGLRAKGRAA